MSVTRKRKPKIQAIDLFCGVGGLTHGLIQGGIEVIAGVDVDENCRYPFEKNNNANFVNCDVAKLTGAQLRRMYDPTNIKLLAGCAPCQPFSTYSQSGRNKNYESQWPLVLEFSRLVRQVQPELVTMENVPQLVNHEVFQEFLESLKGYKVWWDVVECSKIGVPQTRKRLVLLASRLGNKGLEISKTHYKNVTVRDVIGSLPAINAGGKNSKDSLHISPSLSDINLRRIKASKPGGTWRDWPESLQAECHKKSSGLNYISVYGRMEWDKCAPTMTTQCFGYGNGRFGHPEQNRAISLREAAMLQTFPSTYEFAESDSDVAFSKLGRLIGNAVPVRLGEVIANTLYSHVEAYA